MKNQALFSSKDKSKKLKCRLLQFLFGALRLKTSRLKLLYYKRIQGINAKWPVVEHSCNP